MEKIKKRRHPTPFDKETLKEYIRHFPKEEHNLRYKFASRLSELIDEKDITQRILCDATCISSGAMSNYCRGKNLPSAIDVQRIATYFGVPTAYLYGETDERKIDITVQGISLHTGLSSESIRNLTKMKAAKESGGISAIDSLNYLLTNDSFILLLTRLAELRSKSEKYINSCDTPNLLMHSANLNVVNLFSKMNIEKYIKTHSEASEIYEEISLLGGFDTIEHDRQKCYKDFSTIIDPFTKYNECEKTWKQNSAIPQDDD